MYSRIIHLYLYLFGENTDKKKQIPYCEFMSTSSDKNAFTIGL